MQKLCVNGAWKEVEQPLVEIRREHGFHRVTQNSREQWRAAMLIPAPQATKTELLSPRRSRLPVLSRKNLAREFSSTVFLPPVPESLLLSRTGGYRASCRCRCHSVRNYCATNARGKEECNGGWKFAFRR